MQDQGVNAENCGNYIVVRATDECGFDVSMSIHNAEWMVSYGNIWHQHCKTASDAADSMLYGLSKDCRLRSVFRGNLECRATLEMMHDGEWRGHSMTGLLIFPFWRKRRIVVRQNGRFQSAPRSIPDYF